MLTKPLYNKESSAKLKRKADETIPYAEPYRDTFTKKDKMYRKKANKKAIKTLTKKRKH